MNPTIKNHKEKVIGYKALKKDGDILYTDGMNQGKKIIFEQGKEYSVEGKPELCKNGIHFFRHYCFAIDYLEPGNVICKVESLGDVQEDTEKCVTNKIKILEIEYEEELDNNSNSGYWNSGKRNSGDRNSGNRNSGNWNSGYSNSGHRNSGYGNSGNSNSGDRNSGHRNSGNWNSGNRNSGDMNSGDMNSGHSNSGDSNSGDRNSGNFNSGNGYRNFFCTDEKYFLFNIECTKEEAEKCYGLDMSWFDLSCGDYKKAWSNCPKLVLEKIKKLKNFDSDKFNEITGLKI